MAYSSLTYGTTAAITITLASLASDTNLLAGRQGTAVNNITTDAIDIQVSGIVTASSTGVTAAKQCEIWLGGSVDNSAYSGSLGASDANITLVTKSLLKLLIIIPTSSTSSLAYNWGPFSVAQAFGGVMPPYWVPYVVQNTGAALNAASSGNSITYVALNYAST